MTIGIYSDIVSSSKKSAIGKIADDLEYYLNKWNFKVKHITDTVENLLQDLNVCDVIIAVPEICMILKYDPNLSKEVINEINKKVIPIFHHYPFTEFSHFKHNFFHGFWDCKLGYTNLEVGLQIGKFTPKYEMSYLPMGVNTMKYFPTRRISKIQRVGFVGKLSNIIHDDLGSWVQNKRPDMFIEIAKTAGVDWVSISESKNRNEDGHKLYEDIDLVICTSVEEGNPMGLLESIACKIPFISTHVGLTKEYNSIKTFKTIEEAVNIINELNSSDYILNKYINDTYYEIIPNRDWNNLIPKYWIPTIVEKLNMSNK
jgi:glycosyltransferase involved in cell wall biosynthesis